MCKRVPGAAFSVGLLGVWGWAVTLLLPAGLGAQTWAWEAEVGANLFFGNTEQKTVASRLGVERADSAFEVSGGFKFDYGEAQDKEGSSFVNRRSWVVDGALDYRPFAPLSPFAFVSAESSLESRIDRRYSGGAGGKYTFIRGEVDRLDVSLAALGERTTPRPEGDETASGVETLGRLSGRLRFRKGFSEGRITLAHETSYRPRMTEFANYTVQSLTSLAFQVRQGVSLKVSFEDRYDSRAKDRGASGNNDGKVLFGLLTTF